MEDIKNHASIIERVLNENGIMPLVDLPIYTNISANEVLMAIGWLACEGKLILLAEDEDDWRVSLLYPKIKHSTTMRVP